MPVALTRFRLVIAACLFAIAGISTLRAAELTVFAAASLTDALGQIATDYRKVAGDTLVFNFAGSNTLARQIREGAPADVFISADDAQMDALDRAGLLAPGTRRALLTNTLVIIVPDHDALAIAGPADLLNPALRHLALGEPRTVPAGVYARAWLARAGLWQKLSDSGKIVSCENVRAALAAVESGDAGAAIVYRTDALISKHARIAFEVPARETPGIVYPAAVVKNSRESAAAEKFAAWLASPDAMKIFARFGFSPAPQQP